MPHAPQHCFAAYIFCKAPQCKRVPYYIASLGCCLQQVVNGNSAAAQPPAAVQEADRVDYSSWPVKELRRFLTERGVDPSGIVEKNELVSQARQSAKFACHRTDGQRLIGLRAPVVHIVHARAWHPAAAGIAWVAFSTLHP